MSIFEEKRREEKRREEKDTKPNPNTLKKLLKIKNAHVMMISEETESELGEISMVNGWSSGLHRTYIK